MPLRAEIVVTGVGVISPIGIGKDVFYASLLAGKSGVHHLGLFDDPALPPPLGANVADFDPKLYVRPRKSLKVMSREIQFGFAAADLACTDAGLHQQPADPERFGVVFGADLMPCELSELLPTVVSCLQSGQFHFAHWGECAMADLFPLWMLKYLPNMPACHIGIAQDARGPNNTLTLGEVSSVAAMAEAARVLERGAADVMIVGGTGSRLHPMVFFRFNSMDPYTCGRDPAAICRPFDAARCGTVNGEGSAALIFESRQHAESRGATILARVLGFASAFERPRNGQDFEGSAIRRAIRGALQSAQLAPAEIGHVNANGLSTIADDRMEAQAIRDVLGDVPVTALKSYFGNVASGGGALETAASLLSLASGEVPHTLNYETPDPLCPVSVIRERPVQLPLRTFLKLSHSKFGQAMAIIFGAPT